MALQQTIGNRAVQRLMQVAPDPAVGGADNARTPVQRDDDDDGGWLSSIGDAVSSVGSSISSGVSSAVDAGEGLVSDAGSAIASGAKSVASDVSDVAGEAWQGTKSVAGDVADFGKDVYGQMKKDAGYVQQGVGMVGKGIDWAEDEAKSGTGWLADKAKGIPVLEQVADAGKSFVDTSVDITGGALKGVTGMAGGILSAAADPVDTAKALYTMSEHIPGVGLPQKMLSGAYDLAFTDKSLGDVANQTLNPMEDARYWGNMAKGLWSPLQQSINAGKPGEAVGQAGVQIAAMFTGAGEAGVAGEAAEGAEAAQAAEAAEAAEGAEAATGAEAAEGAGAASSTPVVPEEPAVPSSNPTPAAEPGAEQPSIFPDWEQSGSPTKPVSPDPHVIEPPPQPGPAPGGPYRTPATPADVTPAEVPSETPANGPAAEAEPVGAESTASKPPSDPYDVEGWNKYYEQNPNAGRSVGAAAADDESIASEAAEEGTASQDPDMERMLDEVEAEGRGIRADDSRAVARETKLRSFKEDMESGIRSPETEQFEQDAGRDNAVALADEEAGLKEAGGEVNHKLALGEAPEWGTNEDNLELLEKQAHRRGFHGNNFAKQRVGVPADPSFDENLGFSGDRRRGVGSLDDGLEETLDDQAVHDFQSQHDDLIDLIDEKYRD